MDKQKEANNFEATAQPVVTDNEATNCSESMSTNEEDYGEVDHACPQGFRGQKNQAKSSACSADGGAASVNGTSSNGLSNVRNRLSTPKRVGQRNCCDDIRQSESCFADAQSSTTTETQDEEGETTTLSLASATQAPPSYGTATRGAACAILDASQLQNQEEPNHLHHIPASQARDGDYYGPLPNANLPTGQKQLPLFRGTIAASRTIDTRLGSLFNEQNQSFSPWPTAADPATSADNSQSTIQTPGSARYLSNSASLSRIQLAHLNASRLNTDDFPQHQINLRLDNNHAPKPNRQQQQTSSTFEVPINHVISAPGSIHWKPQTNQYSITRLKPIPAPTLPIAAALRAGKSSQAQGASIMDTRNTPPMGPSTTPGDCGELTINNTRFPRSISDTNTHPIDLNMCNAHLSNQPSQHHNQGRFYTSTSAATTMVPLRASDENLHHSSRRQQQTHRKRRRHRSTSGRSLSPQSCELRRYIVNRAANANGQSRTIDASISRSALASREHSVGSSLKAYPTSTSPHARASKQAISAQCWLIDSSDDQLYTSTWHPKSAQSHNQQTTRPQSTHLTVAMMRQSEQHMRKQSKGKLYPESSVNNSRFSPKSSQNLSQTDLCAQESMTNLRANSLRMERILDRNQAKESNGHSVRGTSALGTHNIVEGERYEERMRQRSLIPRGHGRRSSTSSTYSETSSSQHARAGAVVRLSALLSLVSSIVKRTPKCLKVGSNAISIRQDPCRAPANSISGSISAPSGSTAPYIAASIAISSSSSTSAYATGSSHLSSGSNPSRVAHSKKKSIMLSQFKGSLVPPSNVSTTGSSMFYSTGANGTQALSSYGYEYCDADQIEETQFCREPAKLEDICDKEPSSNPTSLERTSSRSSTQPRGQGKSTQESRLAHMIMSDNELISAGSDLNNEAGFGMIANTVLPSVVCGSAPSAARRRWWWISLKNYIHQPCKKNLDSECGTDLTSNQGEAARYKSLRSRRSGDHQGNSSTLHSVISLAKADRVFRIRLIASIIVSFILLALICLLAGLIYSRSSLYQRAKLNLLIDDSDYDLSWLWPQSGPLQGKIDNSSYQRPSDTKSPAEQAENSLRLRLVMIERSERFNQFQQTIAHLTSIQLANDNFIDITQLSKQLIQPAVYDSQTNNRSTNDINNSTYFSSKIQLNEADHDLICLTLLSNLHWPLVKWRHQNQQSIANFLSFTVTPVSFGGPQNLRNVLALLMLSEFKSDLPDSSVIHLNQFAELNTLLHSVSYHLLTCSQSEQKDKSSQVRKKFCSNLISRYRRMMILLGILSHNQLTKLHRSYEPLLIANDNHVKSSRSLLGFFLERLSLLDVQTLSDVTMADYESEFQSDTSTNQMANSILNHEGITILLDDKSSRWHPKNSLYELAKAIIGENPVKLSLDFETHREYQSKFHQMELENSESWNNLLVQDILFPWISPRLPRFVQPSSYDIFLHPNLTTRLIMGMVKIEFQIDKPTKYIVVNCDKLNLVDISMWQRQLTTLEHLTENFNQTSQTSALRQIPIRRVLFNPKLEQIYIEFYEQIEPSSNTFQHSNEETPGRSHVNLGEVSAHDQLPRENHFIINISFNKTTLVSNPLYKETGIEFVQYSDYFSQPEAEVKTILYTQFEPSHARRLFPCFDEPQFKARFQLNLVHEIQHQVLFNAPKRERVPYTSDGAIQMSVFEQTSIPLCTYLVSFVVCDSQNMKSITSRVPQLQSKLKNTGMAERQEKDLKHIQIQILAQFEYLTQAEYASQLVPQLLSFYQTHLQCSYPLDKLDLIAIPKPLTDSGLKIDTMENMGLIWFKAPLLLVDTNLINQNLVEQISLIISHQLAHQYFGNIVSVRTWNDLWLYEAICQYLEAIALGRVQADWKLEEQFVVTSIQETLVLEQFDSFAIEVAQPEILESTQDERFNETYNFQEVTSSSVDVFRDLTNEKFAEATRLAPHLNPTELKRKSALFHMLLFNLLPSTEARASLIRRCLNTYRYKTMSSIQFWSLFGDQLRQESSLDRLSLDITKFTSTEGKQPANSGLTDEHTKLLRPLIGNNSSESSDQLAAGERVVFVRPPNLGRDGESSDFHKISVRSNRLVDNLNLVADIWLSMQGYPLVTASSYRDRLHLKQERFTCTSWNTPLIVEEATAHGYYKENQYESMPTEEASKKKRSATEDDRGELWPIPIMFVSKYNMKQSKFLWMDRREMEFSLNDILSSQDTIEYGPLEIGKSFGSAWFKLNTNQSSIMRVNYDERNWEALTELLLKSHYSNHILGPLDRANLIDDALTLMRCGKLSVGIAMNLTLYLEVGERDYMPWTSALKHLDQMQTLLNQNPLWHRYVLKLMEPISSVIGWKDDGPHLMRKLRRNFFAVALQYGDEKTVNKAKQEFKVWFKSNRFIVPNLQELVYVAGVRYGDQQEWFHCWQRYQQLVNLSPQNTHLTERQSQISLAGAAPPPVVVANEFSEANVENEKRQLLTALASTHNTWLLEQFLNYSLDSTKIQPYHLKHVMQTLGKNPVARLYLWRFVRLNWASLMDKFVVEEEAGGLFNDRKNIKDTGPEYNNMLETLIVESTKHFATKLDYEEVKSFFDAKRRHQDTSSIERAIQQSLQVIRSNIHWRDFIEPKLTKWLLPPLVA